MEDKDLEVQTERFKNAVMLAACIGFTMMIIGILLYYIG